MSAVVRGKSRRGAAAVGWVLATILAELLLPFGGFVVVLVSLHPRFSAQRPSWLLLTAIAGAVLAVQILGLSSLAGTPLIHSGSSEPAS